MSPFMFFARISSALAMAAEFGDSIPIIDEPRRRFSMSFQPRETIDHNSAQLSDELGCIDSWYELQKLAKLSGVLHPELEDYYG